MKRLIFAFLVIAITSIHAFAKYSGGSGDANTPYRISDYNDLYTLADTTSDYNKCFVMTADINLDANVFTTAVIAPNTSTPFKGIFDGGGHRIINLTILGGQSYLGLFGDVNGGEIKNLGLLNISITGQSWQCYAGGIVAWNDGSLNNCYSRGTIINHGCFFNSYGGLVGLNGSGGTISRCFSDVNVTTDSWEIVNNTGGIAGTNNGSINNSFSTGRVVSGGYYYGGFVGYNAGSISNCYSVGLVQSSGSGLIGYNIGTVTASFWDVNTSGASTSAGGTGKTTVEMKTKTTFTNAGWDFNNVWTINDGVDYPKLTGPILPTGTYSGGTGEPNNPYQIADVNDLLALGINTGDYNKCFIMTNDIDLDPCLSGNQVFSSAVIASGMSDTNNFNESPFAGVFDSAGHKILNLKIVDADSIGNHYLGLFGKNTGIVKNLFLENVNISSGNNERPVGGLAGVNDGSISNCYAAANISSGNAGGLLVGGNSGNISNCHTTGYVSGDISSGGVAGYNGGSISDSFSTGAVSGATYVGGLVGNNYAGHITNCYSTGNVSGCGILGGLVGDSCGNWLNSPKISNCYSTGNVTGCVTYSLGLGGLVGSNWGNGTTIINCYSAGTVSGGDSSTHLGGLVGYETSGDINSSYFLNTTGPNNGFGTPLADSQMKQQANFVGWDFVWETANGTEDIWAICEGVSYPKLAWQFVVGDSDNDKDVDFTDFAIMGNKWRQADTNLYCGGTDLTGDGLVDIVDLAAFAEHWLQGL